MNAEIWKPIPGFDTYEASSHGRLRRTVSGRGRTRTNTPHLIKGSVQKNTGYLAVCIRVPWTDRYTWTIHHLVCIAFHGPRPSSQHQVAHGDGTRLNNQPDNLRWATHKENVDDRRRHGRDLRGHMSKKAKLVEDNIPLIFYLAKQGFEQRAIAALFGVHQRTIQSVLHRKTWTHVSVPPELKYLRPPQRRTFWKPSTPVVIPI